MGKSPPSPGNERLLRARSARVTRTALLAERRYEAACQQRDEVNARLAKARRLWEAERAPYPGRVMNSAEARRIVAEMGLTDHVRALVDATPPLTAEQIEHVRRLLTHNVTKPRPGCDPKNDCGPRKATREAPATTPPTASSGYPPGVMAGDSTEGVP